MSNGEDRFPFDGSNLVAMRFDNFCELLQAIVSFQGC